MKKSIISLLLTLATLTANAQIWLGGEIGVNTNKTTLGSDKISSSSSIEISPEIGYNLNDRWAVALRLGYTHLNNHEVQLINITTTGNCNQYSIEPFARYTVLHTDKISFFIDGGVHYKALYKADYDAPLNTIGADIRPGISVALSHTVSLVGHVGVIGYDHSWMKYRGNYDWIPEQGNTLKDDAFNFRLLGSVSFGVNIQLSKK